MRRMIRTLLARANRCTNHTSSQVAARFNRRRLLLASLEDRTVPATFTVNALTDAGTGSGNSGDLRYCLTQAQQGISPGADTIVFDSTLFSTAQTISLLAALPTIDNGLTITGTGSSKVKLDLTSAFNTPFTTDPTFVVGQTITMSGLTMTNADSLGVMWLAFTDANVTLTDVAATNSKTAAGTQVYGMNFIANAAATFTPTITLNNCVVTGNTATASVTGGGGFYSGTVRSFNCDLVISNSTFANNDFDGIKTGDTTSAGGFDAGAIFLQGSAAANTNTGNTFAISNSKVTGNKAWDRSGGMTIVGTTKAISITDCTIENNSGSRGAGVFIASTSLANLQIIRSSISGNTAVVTGAGNGNLARAGGIYILDAATVTIESCSLNNNSGLNLAGAIWFGDMPDGNSFKMSNTTIANNILPSSGGIMRVGGNPDVLAASCQLSFNNCTFANNNKGTGGNFRWFGGTLNFESCIFDGNVGGASPNVAAFTTSTTLGTTTVKNSLVNPSAGMPAGFNGGGNILDVSAKLNALSDNGGGKLTLLPQPGSPVINTGSNPLSLPFDQRGGPLHVRNYGGGVDMGAIEAITFVPFVSGTKTDGTITASNVNTYNIQVTFADNSNLIDVSSLKTGNITVSGKSFPTGTIATFDKVDVNTNGTPRTAFYHINSPGSFFVPGDNGTYTVSIVANQIKTVDTRFVPPGQIATFSVAVSQTFTVDTTMDVVDAFDGVTSLREAIASANGSPATDFISFSSLFASPQTITIDTLLDTFLIADNLVINSPATQLTIDGNQKGVFQVTAGSFAINNLRITNANAGQGAAINSLGTQDITINNCSFDLNSSALGGVVHLNAGSMTVTNSQFSNNKSTGNGGALYLRIGTVVIDRCSFTDNTASTEGGAIDVNFNANFAVDLTIRNTTFSGNSAAQGGALYVDQAASFLLENSTISGNSTTAAGKGGGGLFVNVTAAQKGSTTIRNSTIVNNTANGGAGAGGVNIVQATADPISITSTILAANTHATAPDYSGPTSAAFSKSLLGVANTFTPTSGDLTTGGNLFGSDTAPLNPQVSPLALNLAPAGSPFTHALQTSSPAIDKGSNPASLAFDQRGPGFPRQLKTAVDIGSFEGVLPIPSGSLTPIAPIASVGTTPDTVVVTYSDDVGINFSSIDIGDIEILDPFNNPLTILSRTIDNPTNGTPRVATYKFAIPVNGQTGWDASDNGFYLVNLLSNQVFDIDTPTANSAIGQNLGKFQVSVPNTYVVDEVSDNDDGLTGPNQLSLREAINKANTDGGPTVINFSPTVFSTQKSITMTFGELNVFEALTINGPSAGFVINANNSDRIFNFTSTLSGGVIIISNMTLTNGKRNTTAITDAGGAILIGDENVTLNNCILTNNTTMAEGGAIHVDSAAGRLTLNDCVLTGNSATGPSGFAIGNGGAISVSQGSAATAVFLTRTTVSGNSATGSGGGIYFANNGSLVVVDSTISNNTAAGAAGGGGVYFFAAVGADGFNITNSTISGNKATAGPGGGIELNTLTGTVNVRNSTLTLNESASGAGGIGRTGGTGVFTLSSTIVAQNKSAGSANSANADVFASAALSVSGDNNLIGVMDAANLITLSGSGNQSGTTGTPLNAKLGALALNGVAAGKPMTHALLAGSPALSKGNNAFGLANDQRGVGFARSVGTTDVGAFEDQTAVAPPTIVGGIQINGGNAQRSLVTTIKVTFSEAVTFPSGIGAAFEVARTKNGSVGTVNLNAVQSGNSVTITFLAGGTVGIDPGASLQDGTYQLTIFADKVSGAGGTLDGDGDGISEGNPTDNRTQGLHRLFGDADGNGSVNASDFAQFRAFFGLAGPSVFDFNNDNNTNATDFAQFRARFGLGGYQP